MRILETPLSCGISVTPRVSALRSSEASAFGGFKCISIIVSSMYKNDAICACARNRFHMSQHLTVNYSEQDILSVSEETVLSFVTRVVAFHRLF